MTHKPALLASVALTIFLALVTATRWSSLVSSRSSPAPGEQTVTTSATATEATTADSASDAVSRTGLSLADLPSTGQAVFQPIDPTPPSASDDDGWDDGDDEDKEHEDDHDWSDDDHDDDDDQEQDDDDD